MEGQALRQFHFGKIYFGSFSKTMGGIINTILEKTGLKAIYYVVCRMEYGV